LESGSQEKNPDPEVVDDSLEHTKVVVTVSTTARQCIMKLLDQGSDPRCTWLLSCILADQAR